MITTSSFYIPPQHNWIRDFLYFRLLKSMAFGTKYELHFANGFITFGKFINGYVQLCHCVQTERFWDYLSAHRLPMKEDYYTQWLWLIVEAMVSSGGLYNERHLTPKFM